MTLLIFTSLACCLYLISSFGLIRNIQKNSPTKLSLIFAWLAAITHITIVVGHVTLQQGLDFSFFSIASFTSLIIVLFLLLASVAKPIEKVGIAVFPIAAISLLLHYTLPSDKPLITGLSIEMVIHILSSITAFGLLAIAAVQAILLTLQNYHLRHHINSALIKSLPSLQLMEGLLFQMIASGIVFLSISLLTGFLFIDDLFAQHLVHKTLLSLLAWVIFTGLLLGRKHYGWRGKTAVQWTLYGFISLVLAYFGSKLVLEIILTKTS